MTGAAWIRQTSLLVKCSLFAQWCNLKILLMLVHVSGWQANSTDNLNLTWYFRSLLQNRLILLRGHNPSDQPSAWRRLTQKCFIPVGSFQLTTPRFWESHDEKGHVISLGQCTLHLHSLPSTKRFIRKPGSHDEQKPFLPEKDSEVFTHIPWKLWLLSWKPDGCGIPLKMNQSSPTSFYSWGNQSGMN